MRATVGPCSRGALAHRTAPPSPTTPSSKAKCVRAGRGAEDTRQSLKWFRPRSGSHFRPVLGLRGLGELFACPRRAPRLGEEAGLPPPRQVPWAPEPGPLRAVLRAGGGVFQKKGQNGVHGEDSGEHVLILHTSPTGSSGVSVPGLMLASLVFEI